MAHVAKAHTRQFAEFFVARKSLFPLMLSNRAHMACRVHWRGASPTVPGTLTLGAHLYMKKQPNEPTAALEPLGIVISQGSRAEQPPRFLAYVWGPAPEEEIDAPARAA